MSRALAGSANVLLTDLYELTMLQAYFEQRMNATAVLELLVRKLPHSRNFLLAAGLAQVVASLVELRLAAELARLPDRLPALEEAAPYPVEVARALRRLATEIDART